VIEVFALKQGALRSADMAHQVTGTALDTCMLSIDGESGLGMIERPG
jgi:hypothetical protein